MRKSTTNTKDGVRETKKNAKFKNKIFVGTSNHEE